MIDREAEVLVATRLGNWTSDSREVAPALNGRGYMRFDGIGKSSRYRLAN